MKKLFLIIIILILQSFPSYGSSPNGKGLICKCVECILGTIEWTSYIEEKKYPTEVGYFFKNDNHNYEYTKIIKKDNNITIDVLKNGKLYRTVNGDTVSLNEKQIKGATGGINSVIYFATLPHKLNDASVNKTYIGDITIKEKNYAVLGITFNQEGGGEDFDDQYRYWINTETKKIDYLAYNYSVNNGGVRFRAAYNKRGVDGITFQDYTNYEAEVGTPLDQLPELLETRKLKEFSKIKTEDIINLTTK